MFGHLDYVAEIPACNRYRCSLCHTLGRDYGLQARFLTNYDISLCALVVLEPSVESYSFHRPICPMFSRNEVFKGNVKVLEFLAAVTVVLAAEKVKDDVHDEGHPPSWVAIQWMKKRRNRSEELLRQTGFDPEILTKAFDRQRVLEEKKLRNLRLYSRPSSEVMGSIYAHAAVLAGRSEVVTYRTIGEAIGEIIYFCDSVADYTDDIRHHRFNPFVSCDQFYSKTAGSLPGTRREEVGSLFAESFEQICSSLAMTSSTVLVRELLVTRLQVKITEILTSNTEPSLRVPVLNFLTKISGLSPLTLMFFPRMAFAGNGRSASDSCFEALIPLGIMLFIMNALMKKCVGQGLCGRRGPDRVTVEDSCGGKKTYKRDACTGKYKKEGC